MSHNTQEDAAMFQVVMEVLQAQQDRVQKRRQQRRTRRQHQQDKQA